MVLGMHRSGTSAVAGYLCRHGFLAPTDALPADLKNPTGYWEPQAIVSLHEQLLGDSQTSWDDTWLPPEVIKQAITNTNLSHIYDALSRSFPFNTGSSDVALVKDPRLCRWLPLWNRFTEDNNIECAVLIVHRHPLAVLKSLARRYQLPADRILLLWLQHTLEAEFHSRRFKRRIISYEEFLKNPGTLMVQAKGFWPHLEIGNHHPSSAGDSTVKQELNHAAEPFNDSAHPAN